MAYTVLARKYRSRTFDEVIGQEPIATTLANAIQTARVHHGYLFTGTRGVGKTSMARILAKALNCLKAAGPTVHPCGACPACIAIAEGQDIDVVEIDAASNTGVDNIRELRGNTAYRPARARFKIYIIDEVHMLSTGAFNALLKTLEEPPGHVKFILATTEIQKVPATIRSRCQTFHFRHISPEAIAKRLEAIVQAEGATAEPAVLRRVARLAHGSMRDALSILDQLLSVAPHKLTIEVLEEILPPALDEQVFGLLRHAAEEDVAAVLADAEAILSQGRGLEALCHDMIEVVRTLMLLRACGPDSTLVDVPAAARDEYLRLSRRFELSQYVQMIALLEELRRNVRYSGAGRALTDALLVRLAHMRRWTPIEQLLEHLPAGAPAAAPAAGVSAADEKKKPAPRHEVVPARSPPAPASSSPPDDERPPPTESDFDYESGHAGDVAEPVAPPRPRPPASPATIPTRNAAATSPPRAGAGVSSADRAAAMKDPLVRQVLDLFDGELAHLARRAPPSPANATE